MEVIIFYQDDEAMSSFCTCIIENSSLISSYISNIFRKGIHLVDEISAYIFFPNNGEKPKLTIKNFIPKSKLLFKLSYMITIIEITELSDVEALDSNCDLNDIIRINENRFVFISTTINRNKNIIILFDLYNDNNSLMMRKYRFNLKGKITNSSLRLFLFLGFIGFSGCYTKEKEKGECSFSLLSYGSTTDYLKVDDFLMKLDLNQKYNPLNLEDNIVLENNIFGFEYVGTIITSIPDKDDTGLLIMNSQNKKEIRKNDILYHNSIIFSYVANNTIIEGEYLIEFVPIVNEKSSLLDKYSNLNKIIGENKNQNSFSKNYTGRHGQFIFNIKSHCNFYCHQNCYSCYKTSISDDEQFCIICQENFYFIENTNNCFKDPLGYYFNERKQVYSKCHSNCTKCSKGPEPNNMNCDECKEEFNLNIDGDKRNCYICHNSFYYIYNEDNKKTRICLKDNELCPEIKPYEIIETKECNLTCSYEDLINLICKPSNLKIVAEQMKNILKEQIATNNEMVESVLNNTFEDVTIDGYNSIYQISTTKNQKLNIDNNDGISTIDLNECEKVLKKTLNISDNITLILLKEDLKLNASSLTKVEYEVYNPFSREKLDLDECKGISITISVPIEIDEKQLQLYKSIEELGYNPFDPNDPFYNDLYLENIYYSYPEKDLNIPKKVRKKAQLLDNCFVESKGVIYVSMYKGKKTVLLAYDCASKKVFNSKKKLIIPKSVKVADRNYKITGIGTEAFAYMKKLNKVIIKADIESINSKAFYKCSRLKRIRINSKRLKKIKKNAFAKTKKITFAFPKSKIKKYRKLLKKSGIKKAKIRSIK